MTRTTLKRLRTKLTEACIDARTGVFVFNGGEGELHFEFGSPVHAALVTEKGAWTGLPALERFSSELSRPIKVAWVKPYKVKMTIENVGEEELLAAFSDEETPKTVEKEKTLRRERDFFPPLPLQKLLFSPTTLEKFPLEKLIPSLPNSLLVLTAADTKSGAVVKDGKLIDVLFVKGKEGVSGALAGKRLLEAKEGQLAAYTLDQEMMLVVHLLWHLPVRARVSGALVDPEKLMNGLLDHSGTRVILIQNANEWGVLVARSGEISCSYTDLHPSPSQDNQEVLALINENAEIVVLDEDLAFSAEVETGRFQVKTEEPVTLEETSTSLTFFDEVEPEDVETRKVESVTELPPDDLVDETPEAEKESLEPLKESSGTKAPLPQAEIDEAILSWEGEGGAPVAYPSKEEEISEGAEEKVVPEKEAPAETLPWDFATELFGEGSNKEAPKEDEKVKVEDLKEVQEAKAPEALSSDESFSFLFPGAGEPLNSAEQELLSPLFEEDESSVEVEDNLFVSQMEIDWKGLSKELERIATQRLGGHAGPVIEAIKAADQTVTGIRLALAGIREQSIPGVADDTLKGCVRLMLSTASEMLSGS